MLNPIRPIFARHGLRFTVQREAVYRALASTKNHPTAEELFGEVRKKQASISLATIYNTLDVLTRRGMARKFTDPAGNVTRFDADTAPHSHVMTEDGRIRDIPPDLGTQLRDSIPPAVLDALERRMGVRIDSVRIELHGTTTGGVC